MIYRNVKFQITLKFLTTKPHFSKSVIYIFVINLRNMYVLACIFTITMICFPRVVSSRHFRKKSVTSFHSPFVIAE